MENFVRDVRASVRTLMKKPGFTVVVVLMLACGIAANTAIFSVVNGVLLRALPYRQDDRMSPSGKARPNAASSAKRLRPLIFSIGASRASPSRSSAWPNRGAIS